MKGFLAIYVNGGEEEKVKALINLFKQENKELLERLPETGYAAMFIPTSDEATRIEKIDLDFPFPRFTTRRGMEINPTLPPTPSPEPEQKV